MIIYHPPGGPSPAAVMFSPGSKMPQRPLQCVVAAVNHGLCRHPKTLDLPQLTRIDGSALADAAALGRQKTAYPSDMRDASVPCYGLRRPEPL